MEPHRAYGQLNNDLSEKCPKREIYSYKMSVIQKLTLTRQVTSVCDGTNESEKGSDKQKVIQCNTSVHLTLYCIFLKTFVFVNCSNRH